MCPHDVFDLQSVGWAGGGKINPDDTRLRGVLVLEICFIRGSNSVGGGIGKDFFFAAIWT